MRKLAVLLVFALVGLAAGPRVSREKLKFATATAGKADLKAVACGVGIPGGVELTNPEEFGAWVRNALESPGLSFVVAKIEKESGPRPRIGLNRGEGTSRFLRYLVVEGWLSPGPNRERFRCLEGKKMRLKLLSTLWWCGVFSTFVVSSIASGLDTVRLGTPVKVNPAYNLPIMTAEAKGFWREQGIRAEFYPLRSGPELQRTLAAGRIDMGISTAPSAIIGTSLGVAEVIAADLEALPPWYFWVLTDSPLRRAGDMKGARVGITNFASLGHAYILMVARKLGLEKDIKLVAVGGIVEQMATLKAGHIDVTLGSIFAYARPKFDNVVRELLTLNDYWPKEWMDIIVFAHRSVPEKSPYLGKKVVQTLLRSTGFIMANKAWVIERLVKEFGYPEGLAQIVYPLLIYSSKDGQIKKERVANIRNFLVDYQLVPKEKVPLVEQLYTPLLIS